MIVRVAQVKCYSCGRVCGEVKGEDLYGLSLQDMYVPKYAGRCGPSEDTPFRCSCCGGLVYIDQPFSANSGEVKAVDDHETAEVQRAG